MLSGEEAKRERVNLISRKKRHFQGHKVCNVANNKCGRLQYRYNACLHNDTCLSCVTACTDSPARMPPAQRQSTSARCVTILKYVMYINPNIFPYRDLYTDPDLDKRASAPDVSFMRALRFWLTHRQVSCCRLLEAAPRLSNNLGHTHDIAFSQGFDEACYEQQTCCPPNSGAQSSGWGWNLSLRQLGSRCRSRTLPVWLTSVTDNCSKTLTMQEESLHDGIVKMARSCTPVTSWLQTISCDAAGTCLLARASMVSI